MRPSRSQVLELTVAVPGPGLAISVVDLILRRNRYRGPGPGLHDETPASAYWYHGGVNMAGVTAQVLGTAAALLCINSTDFQGPSPPHWAEPTCPRWSAPPSGAVVRGAVPTPERDPAHHGRTDA
ncbi:hypothetical protein [Streptomyces sp. NPDC101455]|uniref:hypothetical protein n=1 Tax=Streptomyces sp. NPDC101455 TaxID=3366142 RepID=UPI0038305CFD